MNSNAVSNSDKVGLKSRIPVSKSRIPTSVAYPTSHKYKNSASSLEKPSFLSQKSSKPLALTRGTSESQNRTAKNSTLIHNNKVSVKQLQNGKFEQQRKITKEIPNALPVHKKTNINMIIALNKSNPQQRTSNKVPNAIVNKNSKLHTKSDLNKNFCKKVSTKELKQSTSKESVDNLLKKSDCYKSNLQKEYKKVPFKINIKKINDLDKRQVCNISDKQAGLTVSSETKENNTPLPDYFASQNDVKFEVNEFNRNMILSGKELSPSILKLQSGFKLSSNYGKRSSIYQKFVVPSDPFKEALKAIENASLSVKENRKTSLIRENMVLLSPFKERNSFYTPCSNPKNEALKSLEAFKLKLLQKKATKSVKKVRFNLNVQEYIPMDRLDTDVTPFKTTELQLTQINEKSEENTPNYPESKMIEYLSIQEDENNRPTVELSKSEYTSLESEAIPKLSTDHLIIENNLELSEFSNMCIHSSKLIPILHDINSNSTDTQFVNGIKEIPKIPYLHQLNSEFSSPVFDNNIATCDTTNQNISPVKFHTSFPKNKDKINMEVPQRKVYTPRPFSIYSKSSLIDISSPEILAKGAKNLSAPIQTPLVLRSLAKSTALSPEADLSPIRLKLDFTEDQSSPIKESVAKIRTSVTLDKIATTQKLLDELADEECHIFLVNESLPVMCGRYLQNPIASILIEGDDMHFVPIKF